MIELETATKPLQEFLNPSAGGLNGWAQGRLGVSCLFGLTTLGIGDLGIAVELGLADCAAGRLRNRIGIFVGLNGVGQ